jgi:hypothetical protein
METSFNCSDSKSIITYDLKSDTGISASDIAEESSYLKDKASIENNTHKYNLPNSTLLCKKQDNNEVKKVFENALIAAGGKKSDILRLLIIDVKDKSAIVRD